MSFDSAFLELMPHTVTVKTLASRGVDGSPTYSTASVSYSARVVNVNRHSRDQYGNVVQARYVAWIASTGVLSANSRYQLPDGAVPPVLDVQVYPDEDGYHHNKVTFGHA